MLQPGGNAVNRLGKGEADGGGGDMQLAALFPPEGVIFGTIYLVVGAFLTLKGFLFRNPTQKRKPSVESP